MVGVAPEGAFTGHEGSLAAFQDGSWAFFAPRAGWTVWDADTSLLAVFDGAEWKPVSGSQAISSLGVNTAADETNRLAVASDATLLTHDGDDHQLKINKAGPDDTASLLFQSGWSGRAEMGLAGNDDFSIKVSPDGAIWRTVFTMDSATGRVGVGRLTPTAALDVDGVIRSSTGFRIGVATLQNGANEHQLSTSAHFSTSGYFAVGTSPLNNQSIRIRTSGTLASEYAIYAYANVTGNPLFFVRADASVGIGTATPHASAALEIASSSRGFLPPCMTASQRDAISSPSEGLIVYNLTAHEPQFWNGTGWVGMAG